jgi:predicted transposase YbfD/YdcC
MEHGLHVVLDVVFHEDDSRVRVDHARKNPAATRRIAPNTIGRDRSTKASTETDRWQVL